MTALADYAGVLYRFRGLRPDPPSRGYANAECPLKPGGHRNARLRFWTRDGKLMFGCWACCNLDRGHDYAVKTAILRWAGLSWRHCFPPEEGRRQVIVSKSKIVAVYPYHDEAGALLYQCVRYEPGFDGRRPKDLRYRRPAVPADGPEAVRRGWVPSIEGVRRVLYRLPELLADLRQPVCVTEGEKKADLLRALGLTATCNPCGALAWLPEYGGWLSGRRVAVFPDHNEAGMRHALAVAASALYCDAESIRIVRLPDLPPGGGVDDFMSRFAPDATAGMRREALQKEVLAAEEWRKRIKPRRP